jgi:hypothetical protein
MTQKPQADYYVGRNVSGIQTSPDSNEWGVSLSGNVRISNVDEEREAPEDLVNLAGTQLLRVILSQEETRLQFGLPDAQGGPATIVGEIPFTPAKYQISDGAYEGGPHTPQLGDDLLEIPEEPVERIAEGPEPPTNGDVDALDQERG